MSSRLSLAFLAAIAAALPACAVDDEPGAGAAALITETTDVYFLPPVVPAPARFGDFVPDLTPVVVAEQLDPDDGETVLATLATYTRGGPAEARVDVHLQATLPDDDADPTGYFVVRFRSGDFPLVGGDLVRFRVLLDDRQLASADVRVLDRRRDRKLIDRSQYGFVIAGSLLRVKFRIDRGALAIDSDGDGFDDAHDVCPMSWDPEQTDTVGNGVGDACRCDAVVCEPSRPGCVTAGCAPTTGVCAPEVCIEDAPATFAGEVLGQNFGPVGGAGVLVTGPTGATVQAVADAAGNFTVQVPFAEADVLVSAPGFEPYLTHLGFEPAGMATGYHVTLVPNRAWLDVTVWGALLSPLPGATVTVTCLDGSHDAAVTDVAGNVRFALLPLGVACDVDVTSATHPPGHRAFTQLEPGVNTLLFGLY